MVGVANGAGAVQRHYPLAIVLALYLVIGAEYAFFVPAWQMPDEPAHYNYVRQIVERGALPVMEEGDYDQALISAVMAPGARPDYSLDAMQYEDHQPPLFYILAAPVFAMFDGSLPALRLFSLLASAVTVCLSYFIALRVFPDSENVAPLTAAFVAFLPQSLFLSAGFNNDSLSQALVALALFLSTGSLFQDARKGTQRDILLGVVVGLCFITKAQAHLALPIALCAALAPAASEDFPGRRGRRSTAHRLLTITLLSCAIAAPWWIRNLSVYGGFDVLGLQRHDAVVGLQWKTAQAIESQGLTNYLAGLVSNTFMSSWAIFGWMSVPVTDAFYAAFLAFSIVSLVLFWRWRALHRNALTLAQRRALGIMALLFLLAVSGFCWYNLTFVQHQGRYLFTALIPVATMAALGWSAVVERWRRLGSLMWAFQAFALYCLNIYLLWKVIHPSL